MIKCGRGIAKEPFTAWRTNHIIPGVSRITKPVYNSRKLRGQGEKKLYQADICIADSVLWL